MKEDNKKKTIILTIVGILILLVLVIGSTYAYFSIINNSSGISESGFTGTTSGLNHYGVPVINQGINDLHVKVMAKDMTPGKIGNKYWATTNPDENYLETESHHVISNVAVNGGNVKEIVYNCVSDITVLASGTLVTEDVVKTNDGKIYLGATSNPASANNIGTFQTSEIDLLDVINANKGDAPEGYKTQVSYKVNGSSSIDIWTEIMIENRDANQLYLAGKQLEITVKNENLICSVESSNESRPQVISITKTNDETDKIAVEVETSEHIDIDKYYYSIDSETDYTEWDTNTYTFTGLEAGTTYKIRVYVKDVLGNLSDVKDQDLTTKEGPMYMKALASSSNPVIGSSNQKRVEKVEFVNYIPENLESSDIVAYYDLSDATKGTKANSVIGWLVASENNNSLYNLYIGSKSKIYGTNMSYAFSEMSNLKTVTFNNLDTSEATDMRNMFYKCSNLTTLDLSNFDTSKVTTMSSMFAQCSKLTTLDLSNFDTSKVTTMSAMFSGCNSLTTLDLSNFNTSQVTSMFYMFDGLKGFTTLDLSNFDTSQVTNMEGMFRNSNNLTTLDLSNFDTSKVTNTAYMFSNCENLTTIDMRTADFGKVTSYLYMFNNVPTYATMHIKNGQSSFLTTAGFKGTKTPH